MTINIQTTWMWHDEATNGTMGAIIDLDERAIQWVDQPGCACGDDVQPQSIDDFLNNGAIDYVPSEIVEEMQTELGRLVQ